MTFLRVPFLGGVAGEGSKLLCVGCLPLKKFHNFVDASLKLHSQSSGSSLRTGPPGCDGQNVSRMLTPVSLVSDGREPCRAVSGVVIPACSSLGQLLGNITDREVPSAFMWCRRLRIMSISKGAYRTLNRLPVESPKAVEVTVGDAISPGALDD